MVKKASKQNFIFQTNHEKAQSKIGINSTMISAVFLILTLIFTLGPNKVSVIILTELIISIPLLYVATLTYSKIAYWQDSKIWDSFGWVIGSLGNGLLLNSIGLMVAHENRTLGFVFFYLLIVLMTIYTLFNICYSPNKKISGKIFKYLYFLIITVVGGLLWII